MIMLVERKEFFHPQIGMQSCVGVTAKEYPVRFGNYCTIVGGPYLCNIWAENLVEWVRRNMNSGPIEVTVVEHVGRSIGFVSDVRLLDWCNPEPCVTGHGWPSVAVLRLVAERLVFSLVNKFCGCEGDEVSPHIMQFFKNGEWGYSCHRCGRRWFEGGFEHSVLLYVAQGSDLSIIKERYGNAFRDHGENKTGDNCWEYEIVCNGKQETIEVAGFCEGAVIDLEARISGMADWPYSVMKRTTFSDLSVSDLKRQECKRDSDIFWLAYAEGVKRRLSSEGGLG